MAKILDISGGDKNLSHFMKGIKTAGLEDLLKESGPFTLLAPVNLAFGQLTSPASFDELLKNNPVKLAEILSGHIIKAKRMKSDFREGQKLQTLSGRELVVTQKEGEILINGARILAKDRQGFNGVVHTIDRIFLFPAPQPV